MVSWKSQKGLQSLEVIIAITIFSLLTAGVFILFGSSITENNGLLRQARANALVEEGISAVRAIRDADWESLTEGSHGLARMSDTWVFSGEADSTGGTYIRTITVEDLGDDGKEVTVDVSWTFWGRLISRSAVTRLTNWENVEVWGDWGNPVVISSLDIGPQGRASGVLKTGDDLVCLIAQTSSGTVPSLFSIDVSDPFNPFISDSVVAGEDLYDLELSGSSLYVVGTEDETDFSVYDVTDPANMTFGLSFDVDEDGISLQKDGSTLFVGAESEMHIYDISDPTSPSWISTTTIGSDIYDFEIVGSYAYLATESSSQEVMIYDITDTANPSLQNTVNVDGNNEALSLETKGDLLFVGKAGGSGASSELFTYDITDPINPVAGYTYDIGGDVNEILSVGPYIYLATAASNNEFQVHRFLTDDQLYYHTGLNMAQVATGIDFDDNSIYISLRSNDAFQIIQPSP